MAAQSNIQSLLQDLTAVHSGSQAFVPSSVNNGNPNTAYNNPQPQGSQAMSTGGPLPATVQTGVPWTPPPTNFQGQVNWQQLSDQANAADVPGGFKGFPNILEGAGEGWHPGTVGIGTPTTPPPVMTPPPGGGMNTGGNLPPTQTVFNSRVNGPNDPLFNQNLRGGGGLGLVNLPSGYLNNLYSPQQTPGSVSGGEFSKALGSLGDMNVNLGYVGESLSNTGMGKALGITPDGHIDVAQIADFFIPGNVWMSQTHQSNWLNALSGLASSINPVLGMAVTKVMNYFGQKYANENDSELGTGLAGKIRRALRDRYLKNQANRNPNQQHPNWNGGGGAEGSFGGTLGAGGWGGGFGGAGGLGGGGTVNVNIGGDGPGEISGDPFFQTSGQ